MVITSVCGTDNTGSIPVGHPNISLPMDKNKWKIYFEALKILLFISAGLHMVILFLFLPFNKDWGSINYFKLVGIDLIIPRINNHPYSNIIAIIFGIILYIIILQIIKKRA